MSSIASSVRSLSPSPSSRSRHAGLARTTAFVSAMLSALCAGSVTVFALYAPIFQERLRYSQFQVNGVAIAASIACYLPIPLLGYFCDRVGPAPLSLLASLLFGLGYGVAAVLYRQAASEAAAGRLLEPDVAVHSWTYVLMLAAFVVIGIATCSMYLSAVTTCAKNFGRGRHRGLALAMPIAAYGLSGMWQSQLATRVLYERVPGSDAHDVDVFAFFVFLAVLLFVVGLVGFFALRIVDEDALIDAAVDELERSGLLGGSAMFSPSTSAAAAAAHAHAAATETEAMLHRSSTRFGPGVSGSTGHSYGTLARSDPFDGQHSGAEDDESVVNHLLDPHKDSDDTVLSDDEDDDDRYLTKKQWVLNAETRRFLTDHTMWLFALAFFFMIGPGEAFINNMGSVLKSLQDPATPHAHAPTSAATHVSIVGVGSTVVRLLTGSLTDLLAPRPRTQHPQDGLRRGSFSSEEEEEEEEVCRPTISRVAFLLAFALVLSAGLVLLASGLMQGHGDRFWMVSSLVGAGYGAVFSLTPIIITVIWGVENFGTNWGIVAMFPALGATVWGLVYSAVYQAGVDQTGPDDGAGFPLADEANLCYGVHCYAPTFWAMAGSVWVACGLLLLAWKGRNGWAQRGIVI